MDYESLAKKIQKEINKNSLSKSLLWIMTNIYIKDEDYKGLVDYYRSQPKDQVIRYIGQDLYNKICI